MFSFNSTRRSRTVIGLALAVIAAGAGVVGAGPAQASSGGGCSNWAAIPGTNAGGGPYTSTQSCIGSSGTTVWGWLYWQNADATDFTCWGTLKVRDDTLGTFRSYDVNGCSPMEVVFTGISGHHYHVYSNSGAVTYGIEGNLPNQHSGTVPNSPELYL